jgi:hypothetical protein
MQKQLSLTFQSKPKRKAVELEGQAITESEAVVAETEAVIPRFQLTLSSLAVKLD